MLLRLSCATLFCLHAFLVAAAEVDWKPFATSRSAVVFFDRGSVSKTDDYVHYRIRVEYADERVSRDGKHRYRSTVNSLAAQCEAKKLVVTFVELRDHAASASCCMRARSRAASRSRLAAL